MPFSAPSTSVTLSAKSDARYGVGRLTRLCGVLVLALGALGVLGGLTGKLMLSRFLEDFVPMAVSTAALFMLVGGVLVFIPSRSQTPGKQIFRSAAACMVVAAGLVNALEYVLGFDPSFDPVDRLGYLLQTALSVAHTPMSPATGALFAAAGASLWLVGRGAFASPWSVAWRDAGGLLGLFIAIAGFTISLAYVYGSPLLYGSGVVPVAFSTGLAFLAAGMGIVFDAGGQCLPLRLLMGDSIQARLLRVFPPLVALFSLAHPLLNQLVLPFFTPNDALASSIWAMAFASGAAAVAVHMGRALGASMDRVETIRRQAEQSLRESEERYRILLDTLPSGIVEFDADGVIVFSNSALESIYGYEPGEMNGMSVYQLAVDENDRQEMKDRFAKLAQEHSRPTTYSFKRRRKDGRIIIVQVDWNYRSSRWPGSEGFIASVTDITDRTRAEEELRENEELLRSILQGIKAGIVVIDPETSIVMDMNPVAESIIGIAAEEIIGKPCRRITWRSSRTGEMIDVCPLKAGNLINEEFRVERPDGRIVPITKTVIPAMRGQRMLNYEVIFDFTERKALERQLVVAQRLESIGQLASGIAHEINTPIQYVGDNLSFLETAFAELASAVTCPESVSGQAPSPSGGSDVGFMLEEVPKALAQSREGVARVASIVQAMKRFSHPGSEEKMPLDVNKAIESTVTVARNEWKYHAEVELDLDPEVKSLLCFAGDFNQVMLNMLVNAAHAVSAKFKDSSEKGLIRIRTRRKGQSLSVAIADNGTGIPEKNLQRIYDPFFTTKEVGKGTGQGLAIVHDIVVNKHGGTVEVESEWGKGTTFTLSFPNP